MIVVYPTDVRLVKLSASACLLETRTMARARNLRSPGFARQGRSYKWTELLTLCFSPRGLMDKASDSGSGDCQFDSDRGYIFQYPGYWYIRNEIAPDLATANE